MKIFFIIIINFFFGSSFVLQYLIKKLLCFYDINNKFSSNKIIVNNEKKELNYFFNEKNEFNKTKYILRIDDYNYIIYNTSNLIEKINCNSLKLNKVNKIEIKNIGNELIWYEPEKNKFLQMITFTKEINLDAKNIILQNLDIYNNKIIKFYCTNNLFTNVTNIIRINDTKHHYKIIYTNFDLHNKKEVFIEIEYILPYTNIIKIYKNSNYVTIISHILPIKKNLSKLTIKIYRNYFFYNLNDSNIFNYLFYFFYNQFGDYYIQNQFDKLIVYNLSFLGNKINFSLYDHYLYNYNKFYY